jgi:DNA-binding MarR family transcriptional regulator
MASYSTIEASVRNRDSSALIHELAHALSRAERSVVRQLARILDDERVTVDQWRILQLLADGRGHRMSELSEFAFLPAPSLTRVVDRMVTDGLVHRRIDTLDRRRVLVHLTARGRALNRRLADVLTREQHALLDGADPAETERLLALLAGLADRLR